MSRIMRKPLNAVSKQVRHKLACTVTKGGQKLEILDLESRGKLMFFPCSENEGNNQLCGYCEADLRLCFRIMQIVGFLIMWLIYFLALYSAETRVKSIFTQHLHIQFMQATHTYSAKTTSQNY